MHGSRFVFLSLPEFDEAGDLTGSSLTWMLIAPNNRRLGQAGSSFATFQECHAAVLRLREEHDRAYPAAVSVDERGHWAWRVDLDGATVAVSSRSYLRQQECDYNLRRFLEAIPEAGVTDEIRTIRGGTAHGSQTHGSQTHGSQTHGSQTPGDQEHGGEAHDGAPRRGPARGSTPHGVRHVSFGRGSSPAQPGVPQAKGQG